MIVQTARARGLNSRSAVASRARAGGREMAAIDGKMDVSRW